MWRATVQHGRYERKVRSRVLSVSLPERLYWMISFVLKVEELYHCLCLPCVVLGEVDGVLWKEVGSLSVQTKAPLLPLESPATQSHFISFLPTDVTRLAHQFSVVLIPHSSPKFLSPWSHWGVGYFPIFSSSYILSETSVQNAKNI